MSKFRKASNSVESPDVKAFVSGAGEKTLALGSAQRNRQATPKTSFLLKLEHDDHELLRSIADVEDRSMQWMLRKITSEVIKKKAAELGIVS
jgi:hypothetical protein